MNTDKYTTCYCECCWEVRPIDKVYDTCHGWRCLHCIAQIPGIESCSECGSRVDLVLFGCTGDPEADDTFHVCRICVSKMRSAKDALENPELADCYLPDADHLGTGEPEPICPDVEKEWAKIRKWAAPVDGRDSQ